MISSIERASFAHYIADYERTLSVLSDIKVAWANTRFDRYRRVLQKIAATEHPRIVNYRDPQQREADRVFREAATQVEQLMVSQRIWLAQEPDLLYRKLKLVVEGPDVPPTGKASDAARNTLAELATGALLHRQGFSVRLTDADEDVTASIDGLPPLAVECKRPASSRAIESNLKDIRKQLKRCRHTEKRGMAVIATDRMLGISGGLYDVIDEAHLRRAIDTEQQRIRDHIRQLVTNPSRSQLHLYPTTWLGGVLFVGTVMLRERGLPVTVGVLSMFSVAPAHAAATVAPLIERVESIMGAQ